MKKTLSFLLAAVLAIAMLLPSLAAGKTSDAELFAVNPYGEKKASADTVSAYLKEDGDVYLFLPSDCREKITFYSEAKTVSVDGKVLKNGQTTGAFVPGTQQKLTVNGKKYTLTTVKSANLPAVYLTTKSGSLDYIHKSKNNKESGTILIREGGGIRLDSVLKQIKGRGNSTWYMEKKPYNIKFEDKTDILGMGKAKKWSLLANYRDETLFRNIVALNMAKVLGIDFISECRPVDLYINNRYEGNYLICESVETGSNRVDITDLEKANEKANPGIDIESRAIRGTGKNGQPEAGTVRGSRKWADIPASPADITCGYLIELDFADRYNSEISGFVTSRGSSVTISAPEYATKKEVDYIADFYEKAESAVYSGDIKKIGKYFDITSLVNMYILQELTMNTDAGTSSQYFYKDKSGLLVAAPPWDFDLALGYNMLNHGVLLGNSGIWHANSAYYSSLTDKLNDAHETIFTTLYRSEDFRKLVAARWAEISEAAAGGEMESFIIKNGEKLSSSGILDRIRWSRTGENIEEHKDNYASAAAHVLHFVQRRKLTLDKGFSEKSAMLYYDFGKVGGLMFNHTPALTGEKVTVMSPGSDCASSDIPSNYALKYWCTSSDGKGTKYYPGDEITLNNKTTTLYAVWTKFSKYDADGNGKITIEDARKTLRLAIRLENAPDFSAFARAAEVDGNPGVTVADARIVLRRAIGLPV